MFVALDALAHCPVSAGTTNLDFISKKNANLDFDPSCRFHAQVRNQIRFRSFELEQQQSSSSRLYGLTFDAILRATRSNWHIAKVQRTEAMGHGPLFTLPWWRAKCSNTRSANWNQYINPTNVVVSLL